MKNQKLKLYLKKAAQGIIASLAVIAVLFIYNKDVIVGQVLLYETMPNYKIDQNIKALLGLAPEANEMNAEPVFYTAEGEAEFNLELSQEYDESSDIIGLNDDIMHDEYRDSDDEHFSSEALTLSDLDQLGELADLRDKFYILDKRTGMSAEDFDVTEFVNADMSIDQSTDGPKVLIFHTHSTEMFADSSDPSEGVVGLGEELARILYEKYGIETLHDSSRYDIIEGKSQILGAYERMEKNVKKILDENPSIEMAIDLHRDGVAETTRLVTEVDGQPAAQIMFFNGLSKIYQDGVLVPITNLPNPNLKSNLALSFQMQLSANSLYPGLTRKIYLNAYRYSLHMLPKSTLIEVGAQTNTKAEAFNSIEPLADIIASVVLK